MIWAIFSQLFSHQAMHFRRYDCYSDISHTILMLNLLCLAGLGFDFSTKYNLFNLPLGMCEIGLKYKPDRVISSKLSNKAQHTCD